MQKDYHKQRRTLRVASRDSMLAQTQTKWALDQLAAFVKKDGHASNVSFDLQLFKTKGDKYLAGALSDIGGKGLFTKEVEAAVIAADCDLAVHSMKDMPAEMVDGLCIGAIPKREDPRDSFISHRELDLFNLPNNGEGLTIGTSSVRRAAQLRALYPNINIVPCRGNIQTRLDKVTNREIDGTFLAEAGLKRANITISRMVLDEKRWLPSLAQGALCLQVRETYPAIQYFVSHVTDIPTEIEIAAERAFLRALDGSCKTPIAGLARFLRDKLIFNVAIYELDGSAVYEHSRTVEFYNNQTDQEKMKAAASAGQTLADEIFSMIPDQSKLWDILKKPQQ